MDTIKKEDRYMPIKCATIYQNYIWISSYLFNAFFCFDYINKKMEYLGKFEQQNRGDNLHRQIIRYNESLFFIPICAEGIDVYNTKYRCFDDSIGSKEGDIITNRIALQISEGIAWLLPQNLREPLYILDMKAKSVACVPKWQKEINNLLSTEEDCFVSASGICMAEEKIYLALYDKGTILQIDINTMRINIVLQKNKYHFHSISYYNGALYLTGIHMTSILRIKKVDNIAEIENKVMNVDIPYADMIYINNGFLLVPYQLNEFYFYDIEKNQIGKTEIAFEKKAGLEPCFLNWDMLENRIILYPGRSEEIIIIDKLNLTTNKVKLFIPEQFSDTWILKNRMETHLRFQRGLLNERLFSLEEFLIGIDKKQSLNGEKEEDIGRNIYAHL